MPTIRTSGEYWSVHQVTPTTLNIRWEKEHRPPNGSSKAILREFWDAQQVAFKEHRRLHEEAREKLKAVGAHKGKRFPLSQERKARKYAQMIAEQTGVEMEVNRAFDIYL